MTYALLSGMLKYKWTKEDSGFMTSVVFLWVISVSLGMHSIDGDHIMAGIAIGPMEFSFTLHRWTKWLP
mgnify:CR=1 FL=1